MKDMPPILNLLSDQNSETMENSFSKFFRFMGAHIPRVFKNRKIQSPCFVTLFIFSSFMSISTLKNNCF